MDVERCVLETKSNHKALIMGNSHSAVRGFFFLFLGQSRFYHFYGFSIIVKMK